MTNVVIVALGGAVGSAARYLVTGWAVRVLGPEFPWGTLLVNAVGSMLLAFVVHVSVTAELVSPAWRLALGTGVLGGFTTYSTFNYETMAFLEQRAYLLAGANVGATLGACFAGGLVGLVAGRAAVGG